MKVNTLTLKNGGIPACLQQIASSPQQLYHRGANLDELLKRPRLAVVGSRSITPYGQQVTNSFAGKLAEQGVVIISGLALGVDAVAHQAALTAGGLTIAVLPSSVEKPYPATNRQLAEKILEQGGAIVSEYDEGAINFKQNFVARNRLVAGLADAVLITEAAADSGSLYTAKFGRQQGKPVMAVPGNITNPVSAGTNALIQKGATAVTSYKDVLNVMGLVEHKMAASEVKGANQTEQMLLQLMLNGINDGEQLLKESALDISLFNQTLAMLEIAGKVKPLGNNKWAIA